MSCEKNEKNKELCLPQMAISYVTSDFEQVGTWNT